MNVTGVVNFSGAYSQSQLDQVAFFVNGEIRGVGTLTYLAGYGAEAFYSATVYSNVASGETVEIQVYHAATDMIYTAANPIDFVHATVVGNFVSPYEFMIGAAVDEGIELLPIEMQITLEDVPFADVDLATSIVSIDNDPFIISIDSLTPGVVWTLDNNMLRGTPNPGFVGDASVRVRVEEQTANGFSDEQIVVYRVQPAVMGPNWHPIPPQSANLNDTFPDIDLKTEVDTLAGNCYSFTYAPEFGQSPNDAAPNWTVNTTFQSTMTITTTVQFSPAYQFNHPEDRLAAFIDGELRGAIGPTDVAGSAVFFLSVGNDTGTGDTVRISFYSGELQRYFSYPVVIKYVPFGVIGTAPNPDTLELANLVPLIHPDRRLEMVIQNPDSAVFIAYELTVADCAFPDQIQDRITVPFCYGNAGAASQLITLSSGLVSVCQVQSLNLATLVEQIDTDGFTYTWNTSGDGDFLDENGDGDNRYEFAQEYRPGPTDIEQGQVTLSLQLASGQLMSCSLEIGQNEVLINVNRVRSGIFPWNGQ